MDHIYYPHRRGMLDEELCSVLEFVDVVFVNIVVVVVCVGCVSEQVICSQYVQPLD